MFFFGFQDGGMFIVFCFYLVGYGVNKVVWWIDVFDFDVGDFDFLWFGSGVNNLQDFGVDFVLVGEQ